MSQSSPFATLPRALVPIPHLKSCEVKFNNVKKKLNIKTSKTKTSYFIKWSCLLKIFPLNNVSNISVG